MSWKEIISKKRVGRIPKSPNETLIGTWTIKPPTKEEMERREKEKTERKERLANPTPHPKAKELLDTVDKAIKLCSDPNIKLDFKTSAVLNSLQDTRKAIYNWAYHKSRYDNKGNWTERE
jgi:molecular chaperone DnaK (HSP70)